MESDAMAGVEIVCRARSHEGRVVIIRRFVPLDGGRWREISTTSDRAWRKHHQVPDIQGERFRCRFECVLCGQNVERRAENLMPMLDKLRGILPDTGWFAVPLSTL
jgi:hypothetical protein